MEGLRSMRGGCRGYRTKSRNIELEVVSMHLDWKSMILFVTN
jgi:hypothetical protein